MADLGAKVDAKATAIAIQAAWGMEKKVKYYKEKHEEKTSKTLGLHLIMFVCCNLLSFPCFAYRMPKRICLSTINSPA
jgi:hypothetical protein